MTTLSNLNIFKLKPIGKILEFNTNNSYFELSVNIFPHRSTQRILLCILDKSMKKGMSVSFYPITGEVCDMSEKGEVLGYLSKDAVKGNEPILYEFKINKFGDNFICELNLQGESFLYPSFYLDKNAELSIYVGQEGLSEISPDIEWSNLKINSFKEESLII